MKNKARRSDFHILFEDRDLIAVDKRAGILSVPIPGANTPSVLSKVGEYLAKFKVRALTVHRIDRFTSGVLIFGKNPEARSRLIKQFREHTPVRKYLALVEGRVLPAEGTLDNYFILTQQGFKQTIVKTKRADAERGILHYKVIAHGSSVSDTEASLVEVELITGLKNQIRAQFAYAGHPLIGEHQYVEEREDSWSPEFSRQALHASYLEVLHPRNGRPIIFEARIPDDIKKLLKQFRIKLPEVTEPENTKKHSNVVQKKKDKKE
jgi:23S rRNA pseudouridine1911/1915/1917 synthase